MARKPRARPAPRPERVAVPRSSLVLIVTTGWMAVILAVMYALRTFEIKLGQGALYYRFSVFDGVRAINASFVVVLVALAAVAIFNLGKSSLRHGIGVVAALLLLILSSVWIWSALPAPMMQHSFNMRSPSQEGAFYIESESIESLPQYLRAFDQHIQSSPAEMRGTRILSNPPGMTILAVAVQRIFPPQVNPPGVLERYLLSIDTPEFDLVRTSNTIRLSIVLVALWALSGAAAYGAARQLLPPPGALACAAIATFSPSAIHFTPGKDSAQLLTINLMIWAWLAAAKRDNRALAFLAGVFLAIGAASGLIHFWVAFALFLATAWERGVARTFLRMALPALAGNLAVIVSIDLAIGWNLAKTWLAVVMRFGQIQETFAINRTIWFFIGLPLFALFLPVGSITFAVLAARRRRLDFGMKLAIATVAMMLLTYITGVTYELPRLWVAFLPALTLGLMSTVPLARAQHRKALIALAMIVGVQIIGTAWHWSLLDVRESEYRLSQQRFFN